MLTLCFRDAFSLSFSLCAVVFASFLALALYLPLCGIVCCGAACGCARDRLWLCCCAARQSNIVALNAMVLVYSTADLIVVPYSSPIFQFFALNQSTTVVPYNESDSYRGDWIGTLCSMTAVGCVRVCVRRVQQGRPVHASV